MSESNVSPDKNHNPYKFYEVRFPYSVKFSFEQDDKNTEVIINTKSIEYYFGKDKTDVLLQKELSDKISDEGMKKHILRFIEKHLWEIEPQDCEMERFGQMELKELTEEEVNGIEREIISIGD